MARSNKEAESKKGCDNSTIAEEQEESEQEANDGVLKEREDRKRKRSAREPVHILATLPKEILKEGILSFLDINDLSNLGMVSVGIRQQVVSTRGTYPCILREERLPTEIFYFSRGRVIRVSQRQPFHFLLHGGGKGRLDVKFYIENDVWEEQENMRDGEDCRRLEIFPSRTRFTLVIKRKRWNRAWEDVVSMCNFVNSWSIKWEGNIVWDRTVYKRRDIRCFRSAFRYVLVCANRVAAYPDHAEYPSAEYLMRSLPSWLYQYFPTLFHWEKECTDRDTKVEFSYRPARSIAEWREHMPPTRFETVSYKLDEVPWYRKDYSWFSDSDNDDDADSVEFLDTSSSDGYDY